MELITHPAGRDEGLRLALEDLQLGRWLATKNLLDHTRDWSSRTFRSQVLAAVAAKGDAIAAWCAEQPDDPNALMMRARVLTHRVLCTRRAGADLQSLLPRMHLARRACADAERCWAADPVPWVCRLALAQLDIDPGNRHRWEHWAAPPESLLPHGPWPLLWEAVRRDPQNREAYHRMLLCLQARQSGAGQFAHWVASRERPGSALLVLPLYQFVETYRQRMANGQIGSGLGFWTSDHVRHLVELARDRWFAYVARDTSTCSLLDLNYLAYTLTASGLDGAGQVFEAIGPYATVAPWRLVSESNRWWQDEFHQARAFALKKQPAWR
ncbi:hypothetical protein [Streptomyces sp. NPDC054834]